MQSNQSTIPSRPGSDSEKKHVVRDWCYKSREFSCVLFLSILILLFSVSWSFFFSYNNKYFGFLFFFPLLFSFLLFFFSCISFNYYISFLLFFLLRCINILAWLSLTQLLPYYQYLDLRLALLIYIDTPTQHTKGPELQTRRKERKDHTTTHNAKPRRTPRLQRRIHARPGPQPARPKPRTILQSHEGMYCMHACQLKALTNPNPKPLPNSLTPPP